MSKLHVTTNKGTLFISERTLGTDAQGREEIHVRHWAMIPDTWLGTPEEKAERAKLLSLVLEMRGALQWLLDDMTDAGEAFGPTGEPFDSVAEARKVLVKAGGSVCPAPVSK